MKAILDTSGWYAATVKIDIHHPQAKSFLSRPELIVLSTVFEEIMAIIHNRFGKKSAISQGEDLRNYGITDLTQDEVYHAWKLFKTSSQKVSYVDCTVIAIALKFDLPVFGFDRHFTKLGVTVVPSE